jgi:hypothetical protein
MKKRVSTLAAVAAVLLGVAGSASAQAVGTTTSPTFELGAAFQYLRVSVEGEGDEDGASNSFPFGLAVDAARYWGPLGIVAEGGWANDSADVPGFSVTSNFYHFGAGPRFALHTAGRVRPYAQVLVGASILPGRVEEDGVPDISDTSSAFMVQPGVGATFVMGDGWGLFGDVAYRRSFFDTGSNDIRVLFGARMILD